MLEEKRRLLGKMTFHESAVFVLFIVIVALWLFREPKFMKGWAEHLSDADIGDSTAAMFVVLLLFIIPRNIETFCGGMILNLILFKQNCHQKFSSFDSSSW